MAGTRLLIVGTETYAEWDHIETKESWTKVQQALESVTGTDRVDWARDSNGTQHQVTSTNALDAMSRWFPRDHRDGELVNTILYVVGHGDTTGKGESKQLGVMTYESPLKGWQKRQALEIGELYEYLKEWDRSHGHEIGWVLVLLDCCMSGLGVKQLFKLNGNDDEVRKLFAVASADNSASFTGEMPQAIEAVLSTYTGLDTNIEVGEFARSVRQQLGNSSPAIGTTAGDTSIFLEPPEATGAGDSNIFLAEGAQGIDIAVAGAVDSIAVLNELVADLRQTQPEIVEHFLAKAGLAGTEVDDRMWLFEGREIETRQLVTWLNNDSSSGMFVVTGLAGTGKSAFLGRLFAYAEPALRNALTAAELLKEEPDPTLIPDTSFDGIIHLTSRTLGEATAAIAEIAGAEPTVSIDDLIVHLRSRTEPLTLLVDALDEALEPNQIAASLLRRVSAAKTVRVVIGTRQSLNESLDQNPRADPPDTHLLSALGIDPNSDTPPRIRLQPEHAATYRYAQRRLEPTLGSATAATLAQQIAERDQTFLYARLATTELLAQPHLSPTETKELLNNRPGEIFKTALDRLETIDPKIVPLLRALAYGLGRGLPRRNDTWATITKALHPTINNITISDINITIDEAGPYIIRDAHDGYTTYRLAHRTYAEHFETEP